MYKLMPAYRSTRRHSAAIIVGSKHTFWDMPHWAKGKCIYIPENGVSRDYLELARDRAACLPLRGAFVGRLVPYKGADILLEASASFLKAGQLQLDIIGDGPQRLILEKMVERLDVQNSVRFDGWIPHREVLKKLRTCDFMCLPSIREFGGGVVVEAMALGVTPIVADYAGPSELVDNNTGFRIGFQDKKSLVEGLTLTIGNLIRNPGLLDKLGAAARHKVRENLTWEAKANQITAIYDAILSGTRNTTCFDVST
jgi:glycosyltransferase involved in cell wall biosynthesis